MKNIKLLLFLIPSVALASTNEFDLKKGIDFTGQTSFSMSQLNQLVDNGKVATNRGMVISQTATPDVANNSRYTNFLWMDLNFSPPKVKQYILSSASWSELAANATVQDGSITTAKLADGSVTASKIADSNVTSNKLAASSVMNDKIRDGSVSSNKLANGAIFTPELMVLNVVQQSNINMNGFIVGSTNFGTNVIPNTAFSNYSIGGEKIQTNTITGSNLTANVITTNFLHTNVYQMLPKLWAVCTTNSVVRQAGPISISSVTPVAGANTGKFVVAFTPTLAGTNYGVFVSGFYDLGTGVGNTKQISSYSTNTTSSVTIVFTGDDGSYLNPKGFSLQIFDNQ